MDRRALFFLGAAALCAVLIPLSDPKHRWVAEVTAAVYVVLAVLSALDHWSRSRADRSPAERADEPRADEPPPAPRST